MGLGLGFGFLAMALHWEGFVHDWVAPWGDIFMRLLKLIAVPLVLVSLILGVVNLKDIRNLSRIGLKTILYQTGKGLPERPTDGIHGTLPADRRGARGADAACEG